MSTPQSTNAGAGEAPATGAGVAGAAAKVTPKKATGAAGAINTARGKTLAPTPKDGLFMLAAVMLNQDPMNIDWDKLAVELNLKNASTAKTRFGQICRKYRTMAVSSTGVPIGSPGTPTPATTTTPGTIDPYAGTDYAAAPASPTPATGARGRATKGGRVTKGTATPRKRAAAGAKGTAKGGKAKAKKEEELLKEEDGDDMVTPKKEEDDEGEEEVATKTEVLSPAWGYGTPKVGPAWMSS